MLMTDIKKIIASGKELEELKAVLNERTYTVRDSNDAVRYLYLHRHGFLTEEYQHNQYITMAYEIQKGDVELIEK